MPKYVIERDNHIRGLYLAKHRLAKHTLPRGL